VRRLLLALILVGCSQKKSAPDRCNEVTDQMIAAMTKAWSIEHAVQLPPLALRDTIVATCRREQWTTDLEARTRRTLDTILPTHVGGPTPDANTALAESGPHPDYPTPIAAGTSNIFFLEDPDRGPPAPKKAAIPPRGSLAWTTHAYCDTFKTSFACSTATTGTGASSFRVGRKGTEIAVVEERYGDRVVETTMYTRKPDGTLVQRVRIDARGRVDSALMSRDGKMTGRLRNGANALDGCGILAHATTNRGSELRCLQWTGEPMLDMTGVAIYRAKRDEPGFIIEEANFGIDDKPILDATGKHLYRQERDAFGRVLVERYFDLDNKRVANTDGCSGERTEYEADGKISRVTCLDDADRPRGKSNGVATRELMYDERGCNIGVRYIGKDGKPTTDPDGVAGEDQQVDKFCTPTRHTCIDTNGDPHACGPGRPAQFRTTLDARGNAISVRHFDQTQSPAIDEEFDAFELRYKYDDGGNVTSLSCFDVFGEAIECNGTGFHEKKTTFDDNGRRTSERFVGKDGRAAFNLGASSRRYKHDNYDHPFESQSFDERNKLVEQSGTATIRELYDIRHQRFALVMLDVNGKPARYTACFTGSTCPERAWHAVRIVRLGDGTVEYNQFFDEDGQLIEAISCRTSKCFD
jgi:hypothetical protein